MIIQVWKKLIIYKKFNKNKKEKKTKSFIALGHHLWWLVSNKLIINFKTQKVLLQKVLLNKNNSLITNNLIYHLHIHQVKNFLVHDLNH